MRPFTLLQRSPALRQIPAAGSTFLAYIFKAAIEFQLTRSASHSRPRLAFYSPDWARYFLQESKLLLSARELSFQFFCAGHRLYYGRNLMFPARVIFGTRRMG